MHLARRQAHVRPPRAVRRAKGPVLPCGGIKKAVEADGNAQCPQTRRCRIALRDNGPKFPVTFRFWGQRHLALLGAVLGLVSLASADEGNRGFYVDFSQCTEAVGVGPVSLAKASALVPVVFTTLPIANASGPTTAAIVVLATRCGGVQVDGGAAVPTNISQVGIEVVSPDGTGDINNYSLVYLSDNPELVKAFNHAGLPALLDPATARQCLVAYLLCGGQAGCGKLS
jgi:hypothetical protein